MEIYTHRGSSATAPENTLRAFQEAIDAKADGVELDVHLSADGVPVVIHDENVDRTTNGSGSVHSFTVAQLHLLDAGQGEYVPTLAEVVTLLEGKLKLYIEIKAEGIVQPVLDVLKEFPNAEWLLGSFSHEVLRDARKADPNANLWLISFTAEDKDFAIIEEVGASGLSLFGLALSPEVVSRCKQASLKLATWTVNNPDDAYRCRDLDVQTLCTDAPADIIRALITMPGPAALHA